MADFTSVHMRIPKQGMDLLRLLGAARKRHVEAHNRKEMIERERSGIITALISNGDNDSAALEAWQKGYEEASAETDNAHFDLHIAAENLADWFLALELPF